MNTNTQIVCTVCGSVGWGKKVTPGSIPIELVLWFTFIVPSLIYSIWRLSARHLVCRTCGQDKMILVDQPGSRQVSDGRTKDPRPEESRDYSAPSNPSASAIIWSSIA